jgi:predicted unusual protein kinase regulating ubiquinone biosynthesis (AarF/ABC1/UbiB family)
MPRVKSPRIYWQATQRRVLTMEWIDGVKLTNKVRAARGRAGGLDEEELGAGRLLCPDNTLLLPSGCHG